MRFLSRATTAIVATLLYAPLACTSGPPPEPAPTAVPDVALDSVPAGQALLYVFNASGATLIKGNYKVKTNGQRIADLPRSTYSVLAMKPGAHKLETFHGPDHRALTSYRSLHVALVEGQRTFVVVAWSPKKSWAAGFAGSPLSFTTVSEGQGKLMISRFARRGTPTS
jgi:hypothetical protein